MIIVEIFWAIISWIGHTIVVVAGCIAVGWFLLLMIGGASEIIEVWRPAKKK